MQRHFVSPLADKLKSCDIQYTSRFLIILGKRLQDMFSIRLRKLASGGINARLGSQAKEFEELFTSAR